MTRVLDNPRTRTYTGLFLAALALRVIQVGALPSGDEQITIDLIRQYGPTDLATKIPRVQPHFPLYFLLLDAWSLALPLETARAVSMLAGSLVPVVLFVWLTDILGDQRAKLAAGLVVVSPVLASQSHWLRMYALLTLAVVASWWAAWRYLYGDGRAFTYGVLALLTLALHPFAVAAVASQCLWLTLEQCQSDWRPHFPRIVGGLMLTAAVGGVWLLARILTVHGTGTIEPDAMHMEYATRPLIRAAVLPITTLTGTIYTTAFVLLALVLTGYYMLATIRSRLWISRHGRLGICWVGCCLAFLYVGHAVRPILMLKYVAWLGPGVAVVVATLSRGTRLESVGIGGIVGMAAMNLALGVLIKINNAFVAVWGYGVVEPLA